MARCSADKRYENEQGENRVFSIEQLSVAGEVVKRVKDSKYLGSTL